MLGRPERVGVQQGAQQRREESVIPTIDLRTPLSADPREVALARRRMNEHLHQQGIAGDVADSAVLLVSELVTNAILHGEPPVELRVAVPGGHLHVEVHDSDTDSVLHLPAMGEPSRERLGGRGLGLVAALSSRWGLHSDDSGKCVWFEIDLR